MANKRNNKPGTGRAASARRPTRAEQEQKAKKEQREKIARTVAIVLLVILLLAILGFAGFGIAYLVTDGFGGKVPTAVVMIDDEVYSESTDGLTIYPGNEVRVQSLTGETEYTVKVEGNASTNNFAFTLGEEPYTWRDMDGEDMTAGFTIAQTGTGFTIEYESLPSIITAARGAEAVIEDVDLSGDLFTMVVTLGEREYRFGFGVGLPVSDVVLDPDQIVIQDPDGALQPDEPAEEPGEEPDDPAQQPEEPDDPAQQPEEPTEEPENPAEEPENPAEEPENPAEEPEEPAEEPEEPSESIEEQFIRYVVDGARADNIDDALDAWRNASPLYNQIAESATSDEDVRTAMSAFMILQNAVMDNEYTEEEAASVQAALGDLMERY